MRPQAVPDRKLNHEGIMRLSYRFAGGGLILGAVQTAVLMYLPGGGVEPSWPLGISLSTAATLGGFVLGLWQGRRLDRIRLGLEQAQPGPAGGSDELGRLAASISRMKTEQEEGRRRQGVQVGSHAGVIHRSASSLGATGANLMEGAETTTEQAQRAAAAAEQVSSNAHQIAAIAEEMTASVREIASATTEASRVSTDAAARSKVVDEAVRRLGASSTDIGTVVKTISAIAEQTNLLALNATIEAARAGESGRGFAVVAGEVKSLAHQTAAATGDIGRRIAAIQADTTAAVEAIAAISQLIGRINEMQQTTASAVEEQSATTTEMARNIAEAAKGAADIAKAISAVAQSTRSTCGLAMQVRDLGKQLTVESADLSRAVGGTASEAATVTVRDDSSLVIWTPQFATGHSDIDAQHQQLFRMTGELHVAMQEGRGRAVIGELIAFLANYTVKHFAEEEDTMRQAAYPNLAGHQAMHRTLLAQVGDLQRRFTAGETLKTMEVSEFLSGWLKQHILQVDHAYIPALKAAGSIRA